VKEYDKINDEQKKEYKDNKAHLKTDKKNFKETKKERCKDVEEK
jgi:hypothetical protein